MTQILKQILVHSPTGESSTQPRDQQTISNTLQGVGEVRECRSAGCRRRDEQSEDFCCGRRVSPEGDGAAVRSGGSLVGELKSSWCRLYVRTKSAGLGKILRDFASSSPSSTTAPARAAEEELHEGRLQNAAANGREAR
jgi:hypothetical protein